VRITLRHAEVRLPLQSIRKIICSPFSLLFCPPLNYRTIYITYYLQTYPLKIYSSPNYQLPLLILSSGLQIIFIYHINLHFTKIWRKYVPLLVDAVKTCTNMFHSVLPKLPIAAIVFSHFRPSQSLLLQPSTAVPNLSEWHSLSLAFSSHNSVLNEMKIVTPFPLLP